MTEPQTVARNAELSDLVEILRADQPRKYDLVTPASTLRVQDGNLIVAGSDAQLTDDGVTAVDGVYRPTRIADDGFAEKLGVPPGYLATLRRENLPLFDQNINGWLTHESKASKNYLVRLFRELDGTTGVARAFLSDYYKPIENLDVLMTVLEGIGTAGVPVAIQSADLTDRRMYVRVVCEQVSAMSPILLDGYRSPYTGNSGRDLPQIFAGFEVSNSEVGHGAFSIAPRLVVQVCTNGMTMRADAIRAQHLGGQLPAGAIEWSDDTQAKNLALIQAKTVDSVKAFLSQEWLEQAITRLEKDAQVEVAKPEETIKHVASKLRYSEAQQDDILRMFIKGGQTTSAGVMHAVTASAQNQTDADTAAEMEGHALQVLELAAAHASR